MKLKRIKKPFLSIGLVLIAALIVRILLHPFGTLSLDHGTFVAWSNMLVQGGLPNFYNSWSDYLPGYLYILALLAKINAGLNLPTELLYKLPSMLADVATGFLIYKIVNKIDIAGKNREKISLLAAALYLFNPAVLANSTLWGQVDAFTSLFSLLAVYLVPINFVLSAMALAVGTVIKPQAALVVIPILFVMYQNRWKVQKIIIYGLIGGATFALAFLPFWNMSGNFLEFIQSRLTNTLSQYKYTSVNAFSFWGLGGFWNPDEGQNVLGGIITVLVSALSVIKLRKVKDSQYLVLAVVFLTGFMFMTRMHERHLLPALAPLIIAAAAYTDLLFSYLFLSFTYVANLYYAYIWITNDFKSVFTDLQLKFFIILNLISLAIVLAVVAKKQLFSYKIKKFINFEKYSIKDKSLKLTDVIPAKRARLILIGILIFAGFTRLFMLHNPANEYFDEVYHAFTARVLLNGDPKGWEWWNPNPEGFAYEWTHPPMAKLVMIGGMTIFGENSFGWRIPAALLGILCVYLVYAISKKIFESRDVALFACGLFALEGLPLVMSRIGMNDTYFLVSILLSYLFFLKQKSFASAAFLGLAAASKWSTMWLLPILVVSHLALRLKLKRSYIWFVILPPLIYLASYIPFFTSGHTWEQFVELQKQMWWYHTGLKAEHSYSSPWWSWPFLVRPVWLFVQRTSDIQVANIYAMGNPIVYWFGLSSAIIALFVSIKERNKRLGLMVFGYLAFFATWAASPRIMFMYHYLPSIPFMAILGGYILKRESWLRIPILVTAAVVFIYFYPHWTGLLIPEWLDKSYYWFPSWR